MKYTVVHSTDPYLLARLATDLQMEGCEQTAINNSFPFQEDFEWMVVYGDGEFGFYNHNCGGSQTNLRPLLTSRNYIKVLTQILEP